MGILKDRNGHVWRVPALFFAICLAKILLFQGTYWDFCTPDSAESASYFWAFYLIKISVPLLFGGMVLCSGRKGWSVGLLLFLDIWIEGNLVYYRSNGLCLDGYSSTLLGNLKGFEGGILALLEWRDIIYPALSLLYMAAVCREGKRKQRNITAGIIAIVAAVALHFLAMGLFNRDVEKEDRCLNPFSGGMYRIFPFINDYCSSVSVAHLFIYDISDVARIWLDRESSSSLKLTAEEREILEKISHPELASQRFQYRDTVVLVLVESLESWAVREDAMPNLYALAHSEHVLYADRVKTQIKAGTSADGQLICNTGLLPIDRATVCFAYPHNDFPSLAGAGAGKGVTILPHHDGVWNQKEMSPAYGYEGTLVRSEEDSAVFNAVLDCLKEGYTTIQTLTMSSHVPFNYGSSRSDLQTPAGMPASMSNYLKCMNYTDSNLQILLSELEEGGMLHNATVIITGDHRIFCKEKRKRFAGFSTREGGNYDVFNDNTPLIIYSPHIEGNRYINSQCYQMDLYPTVMGLLGNPDPVWDGFGTNLLLNPSERRFTEKAAFSLSNKLIRSNFFASLY